MDHHRILIHVIFRTAHRIPAINEEHEKELYNYIWGIVKAKEIKLWRIGGMPDHIHMLIDCPPKNSLSLIMQWIKESSSKWISGSGLFPAFRGWGRGYGAFTYSVKERDTVSNYIKRQKEHHKKVSFLDEYRVMLREQEVEYDERFLMED